MSAPMSGAVSVLIPTHNGEKTIVRAIETAFSQQLPGIEIVVLDDGSTDATADLVSRIPEVKLVRQERQGVAGARNAGLRIATGQFIAFLDCDDGVFNSEELILIIRKSKSNQNIPIAMLSAYPERAEVQKGFKAGTTFFLAKPFGSREVEFLLNATRGAMLEERQRYMRVPARLPVLCEWREGARSKHVAGRSLNISNTGMLMTLTPHPECGAAVNIELSLPRPSGKLVAKGIVLRTGPADNVAVRFLALAKSQQEQLWSFVTEFQASSMFPAG